MLHVIKFTCMPMLPILTSKLGCVKKYARGQAIFASLLKLFLQEFQYICLITAYFRAISDSKIHKARILSSRSGVLRFRQILEGYYGLNKRLGCGSSSSMNSNPNTFEKGKAYG